MSLTEGPGSAAEDPGDRPPPRQAGEDTLEEIRRRVLSAVRRNCPAWLRDRSEDVVQNVLVKLLKSMRKSTGNKTFSSVYLEKSVYGALVDEMRRIGRRREAPLETERAIEEIPATRTNPERESSSGEIAKGIQDCLDRLTRPRKLALTLYLYGCTVPETARRLRWNLKRTESLVYRGMGQLRECLDRKGLKP
jgi:RNA polymerase sigma-70 factor (ECF subfamily)